MTRRRPLDFWPWQAWATLAAMLAIIIIGAFLGSRI
jgi:hypothetical protein